MSAYNQANNRTLLNTISDGVDVLEASDHSNSRVFGLDTVAASNATGKLTIAASNAGDGNTFSLDSVTYTFKTALTASGATPYEVLIGAANSNAAANLVSAINLAGTIGTDYGTGTLIHPTCAATSSGGVVTITATDAGTSGNSIPMVKVGTYLTLTAATLGSGAGTTAGVAGVALATGVTPFAVLAGATTGVWGTARRVMDGTEDFNKSYTPAYYDISAILPTAINAAAAGLIWRVRIANSGYTGSAHAYKNMALAVAAKKYSEVTFKVDGTDVGMIPVAMKSLRIPVGSRVWVQAMTNGSLDSDAKKTLNFMLGCQSYEA